MTTDYVNSIPVAEQPPYPGDGAIEWKLRSIIRWNAMATVVRANHQAPGIGGHIATYASAATLYEVGFNWFFRGRDFPGGGDQIFFQGHAAPGIYARAFLERRISLEQLVRFRRELSGGLSSYPHPWCLPDFWEFPTVSMGLGLINSIYQARFNRYLHARGLKDTSASRVWIFAGDGEMDEPESRGALHIAAREALDNLILVVNCNLQRLDGPVYGNGKIIQELQGYLTGAGWDVIKVVWGDRWDPLLAQDTDRVLVQRMNEVPDGQFQMYRRAGGEIIRKDFFGKDPRLLKLVENITDADLPKLNRGGHDPAKVFAAYDRAVQPTGRPTAILTHTIKGYGLGEAGEARMTAHQQKKLSEQELKDYRDRCQIPVTDRHIKDSPFYLPSEKTPEMQYLFERRRALGGFIPARRGWVGAYGNTPLQFPDTIYQDLFKGSGGREASTTMAFVSLLGKLIRDPKLGKHIVPIVPDEARTFGMDPLFAQNGIYSPKGQGYTPADKQGSSVFYYREAKDGQILEEGITEGGSMASFTAAATAYSTHGVPMIPFYIFYSMFGFQRVGDAIWAAADMRSRGFLLGATAGRTTLMGEGLQHDDGHSPLLASTVPNLVTYDPAFAYEVAIIIQHGLKRMYEDQEDVFFYLTLYNENYPMPAMIEGVQEGILRGLYCYAPGAATGIKAQIFASGPLVPQALIAQQLLMDYQVSADVWSVTSYNELYRDALTCEQWNRLHPEETEKQPYLTTQLKNTSGPVIAVSDYLKSLPDRLARWIPNGLTSLGTDGFGRSDTREALRRHFQIDPPHIVAAVLERLYRLGQAELTTLQQALRQIHS